MPKVTIKNLHSKSIHCSGKTEKLIDILLSETDWMHACGKKGRCTTCAVQVLDKEGGLSQRTEAEEKFVSLGKLSPDMRLACQAELIGDVIINAPIQNQLPHLDYSE
ncbi:MAG: (2Fe-2S)-binding protein [Cyclobacteriaceae bacterium]